MKQAIMHLATEQEDYWITDKFMAQYLINELDLHSKVKLSALKVGVSAGIFLITNKQPNNIERLKKMDQLVVSYHQSGYIDFLKFRAMQS